MNNRPAKGKTGHDAELDKCALLAKSIRRTILDLCHKTKSGHVGSSFSIVEILTALYFRFLSVEPDDPENPDRDRLILSKGHACAALYSVLAARGFMSQMDLDGFAVNGGTLEQHPNRDIRKGVEASTGSLGHGLSIGAGMALAAKKDKRKGKVYVILGDGELNEGMVWEAAMFAAHHGLDNLVAVVDMNGIQALGRTSEVIGLEPVLNKWTAFGWGAREVDGHGFGEIFRALEAVPFSVSRPSAVIARTVKGKGVSFMEDRLLWHYRPPNEEEYAAALKELS